MQDSKLILSAFLRLPPKKTFPDYYQAIQNPISLAEIKARKSESLQEIYSDFLLLRDNAFQYNEHESDIAKAASLILKQVEDYVLQASLPDTEAYVTSLEQHELRIMDELANYKGGRSRYIAELFMDEPSREDYPDYYQLIKVPTSINTIKRQIQNGRARTVAAFTDLVQLMVDNACTYNAETSQVYVDAKSLQKAFQLRLDKVMKILPEPVGYADHANAIMKGEFPEEKEEEPIEEEEEAPLAKTPLKLKLKTTGTPKDTPKLKLNLKSPEKLKLKLTRKELVKEEEEPTVEEPEKAQPEIELEENTKPEEVQTEIPAEVELQEEETDALPLRNILRDPEQNPDDSLIKSITVFSVIPITSKYHLQKSPPPPGVLNLFQINIPASLKYSIQSYAFSLPAFHHTISLNSTINEMLNHQNYDLVLSHNYRQINPYSSSTSSPWADANTPITSKFELQLSTGLNLVEITVSSQPGRPKRHATGGADLEELQADKIEKISIWITLAKH